MIWFLIGGVFGLVLGFFLTLMYVLTELQIKNLGEGMKLIKKARKK